MQIETYRNEYTKTKDLIEIIKNNKNKDEDKLKEFLIELENLLTKSLNERETRFITKIKNPEKPKLKKYHVKSFGYKNYDSKDLVVNLTKRRNIILKKGLVIYLEKA